MCIAQVACSPPGNLSVDVRQVSCSSTCMCVRDAVCIGQAYSCRAPAPGHNVQRSTARHRLQTSMSFRWHLYALKVRATQGGFFQLALEQVCGNICVRCSGHR
jgi:hypothetical protein